MRTPIRKTAWTVAFAAASAATCWQFSAPPCGGPLLARSGADKAAASRTFAPVKAAGPAGLDRGARPIGTDETSCAESLVAGPGAAEDLEPSTSLVNASRLRGAVLTRSRHGKPRHVPGARVLLRSLDGVDYRIVACSQATRDAADFGGYSVDLPAGRWRAVVVASGYRLLVCHEPLELADGAEVVKDFVLRPLQLDPAPRDPSLSLTSTAGRDPVWPNRRSVGLQFREHRGQPLQGSSVPFAGR